MKKVIKILLIVLLAIILALVLFFRVNGKNTATLPLESDTAIEATETSPTPEPTAEPTPEPTPEPEPEYFTLSFVGDNTLQSNANFLYSPYGFDKTINGDYTYPYKNTAQYFIDSEYSLANLECTLSDKSMYSSGETFSFKCPTDYAQILTNGGIDYVTLANNHTMDYYEQGIADTIEALDKAGIKHGKDNEYVIVSTPNGLKLGIYNGYNTYHPEDRMSSIEDAITSLKAENVDLIICMFHWGQELYYTPNDNQVNLAHKCIDLGVDIVYGSHPHCLEPIEIYNGKPIIYSAGNWVFGGSTEPSDPDTALFQITVKRDPDGAVSYDSIKAIPCAVTSNIEGANAKANNTNYNDYAAYNNYCPTPYEEGSEGYSRTMSKIDGTFKPLSQGADYSNYYASWNN